MLLAHCMTKKNKMSVSNSYSSVKYEKLAEMNVFFGTNTR